MMFMGRRLNVIRQCLIALQVLLIAAAKEFCIMSQTLLALYLLWRKNVVLEDSQSYFFQNFIASSILLSNAGVMPSVITEHFLFH
jgi:hypothetical protein